MTWQPTGVGGSRSGSLHMPRAKNREGPNLLLAFACPFVSTATVHDRNWTERVCLNRTAWNTFVVADTHYDTWARHWLVDDGMIDEYNTTKRNTTEEQGRNTENGCKKNIIMRMVIMILPTILWT